jgi:hypothetical protein
MLAHPSDKIGVVCRAVNPLQRSSSYLPIIPVPTHPILGSCADAAMVKLSEVRQLSVQNEKQPEHVGEGVNTW